MLAAALGHRPAPITRRARSGHPCPVCAIEHDHDHLASPGWPFSCHTPRRKIVPDRKARKETPMRRRFLPLTLAILVVLVTTLAGAAIPAAAQGTGGTTATLTITFLSCPPGGDWSGPPAGCAEVVPAPETATLTGPDWIQPVHQLQPNADGSYTVPNVPAGAGIGEIGLANFFSPDHNAFTFSGTDVITRWYGGV